MAAWTVTSYLPGVAMAGPDGHEDTFHNGQWHHHFVNTDSSTAHVKTIPSRSPPNVRRGEVERKPGSVAAPVSRAVGVIKLLLNQAVSLFLSSRMLKDTPP